MYCVKRRWVVLQGNYYDNRNYYEVLSKNYKLKSFFLFMVIFQQMFVVPVNSLSTTTEGLFDDLQSLVDSVTNINLGHTNNHLNSQNSTLYIGYANNPFGPSKKYRNKNNNQNMLPSSYKTALTTINTPMTYHDLQNLDNLNTNMDNGIDSNSNGQSNSEETRSKRGVFQLYNMVVCATGCDPLSYKGYGCYCGFLGSGYAVDGIDRCCKMHDWCYDSSNCPMFLEYFVPYLWKCYRHQPLCAINAEEWPGTESCARRLCECDRVLSECLRQFPCPRKRAICYSSPWRLFQNALMIL